MSDYVIRKQEETKPETKSVIFQKLSKKEWISFIKLFTFYTSYSGLIYLSVMNSNLMLTEILVVGGILSLVFFIHMMSNR